MTIQIEVGNALAEQIESSDSPVQTVPNGRILALNMVLAYITLFIIHFYNFLRTFIIN